MRTRSLLMSLLCASCASVPSQQPERPAPRRRAVALDAREFERVDLDDVGGEDAVSRYAARFERKWILGERSGWKLRVRQEESEYDFRGDAFGGLDGLDDMSETTVGVSYWSAGRNGRSYFALVNASSGVADGADFDDGVFFKTFGGVLWQASETVQWGIGLVGRTELEDDPSVFAFPLIEWRIDERSKIGFVQSSDPGLGFTRKLEEALDLYVGLQFSQRQYRLDDDDVDDGAFVDEEQSVRVGLIWDEGAGLNADVFTGFGKRELFLDVDDDEVADDETETGSC